MKFVYITSVFLCFTWKFIEGQQQAPPPPGPDMTLNKILDQAGHKNVPKVAYIEQPGQNQASLHDLPPVASDRQAISNQQAAAADQPAMARFQGQQGVGKIPPQPKDGGLLADSVACAPEIAQFCGSVLKTSDILVLQCLQDAGDNVLSETCQQELWQVKLSMTQDDRFRQAAFQYCSAELQTYPCSKPPAGSEQSYLVLCLVEYKGNMTNQACRNFLTRIESVMFTDFNLVGRFVKTCRNDIERLNCGQGHFAPSVKSQVKQQARVIHSQGGTLECLLKKMVETGRDEAKLAPDCQHEVLRLAEMQADDFNLDRPLFFACRDDRERLCHDVQAGTGNVFNCLTENLASRLISFECRETMLLRMRLMQRDYKISHALVKNCEPAIQENQCAPKGLEEQADHFFLTYILLCLENAMKQNRVVPPNCQHQMFEHRRLLLSEAKMDPEIVMKCSHDIEVHCRQLRGGGETLHCLMGVAKRVDFTHTLALSIQCMQAITHLLEVVDVGSNYKVDRILYNDCKPIIEGACKTQAASETDVLSCLLTNIESPQMSDECEERLLEVQYFLARDFVLDPQLYAACKVDAEAKCGHRSYWIQKEERGKNSPAQQGPDAGIMVLTCLYRHAYVDQTFSPELRLTETCGVEVRRVMRERAVSVRLMPQIEEACLKDLGEHCPQKTKPFEEMICLQEKIDTLSEPCKIQIKNFTMLQSQDSRLDRALFRVCRPVIDEYCKDNLAQDVDNGEIMECVVQNKGVPEMSNKCRTYVNHIELMSMKDYEVSFRFRQSCKKDIELNCLSGGHTDKISIIRCLSEIIVHRALLNEGPDVSKECRKQMKSEYLKMETMALSEWKKADSQFVSFCKADLSAYECDKEETMEKAVECLKERKSELNSACRKYIFHKEQIEFGDNTFDVTLNRACSHEVRQFCMSEDKSHVLRCLLEHKNDPEMSIDCLQVIQKRQREQAFDVRLQPVLYQQCLFDIKQHCKAEYDILQRQQANKDEEEMQAKILTCLRKTMMTKSGLRPKCEHEIKEIILESEIDPQLDPPFYAACKVDITRMCDQSLLSGHGHAAIMECMKVKYKENAIKSLDCRTEMNRKLKELLFDVHMDEALYDVCQLDIKKYCYDVQAGNGNQLKCLLIASHSSNVQMSDACKDKLTDRQQLWKTLDINEDFKAPVGLGDFAHLINTSPSKNYFLTVLLVVILVIFVFGLCFGRVTKRIKREMKNR